MKKFTLFMLAAVLLVAACQDKEEEVFENVSKDIESHKNADSGQNGGGHETDDPW